MEAPKGIALEGSTSSCKRDGLNDAAGFLSVYWSGDFLNDADGLKNVEGGCFSMRIGTIEAGGTKFVCGVGDESGNIHHHVSFPTRTPIETMQDVLKFFDNKNLDALGVGCFGPIEVNPAHPDFGLLTTTPKLSWRNFNILKSLQAHFECPIYLDTDVNAAALSEALWGAAKGLDSCVYITVGTGIGGGMLVEGKLVHGLLHPEIGHMFVRRHADDPFEGTCPHHKDCLEGLAAGPAIASRWGKEGKDLQNEELVWRIEAYYLAQAVSNLILSLSPKKVILGGGVMSQARLFTYIRENVTDLLHGYIDKPETAQGIDHYIVSPGLGNLAGLKGGLALAAVAASAIR